MITRHLALALYGCAQASATAPNPALSSAPPATAAPIPAPDGPSLVFGEGILSTLDDESQPAFAPDGQTLYFLKDSPAFDFWTIVRSRFDGRTWSKPEVLPFSGRYPDGDPFVTRDGKFLYFVSMRPVSGTTPKADSDLWRVPRVGDDWGEPEHLDTLSSPENEYFPTLTDDGTLYFGSERAGGRGKCDLYRARLVNGRYAAPENLGDVINTPNAEIEGYVAPDESFLVFSANGGKGGKGSYDLYLSQNRGGTWTAPVNLGDRVNTKAWEFGAKVSPDGRWLIFTSNRGFADRPLDHRLTFDELEGRLRRPGNGLRDLYWVDWASLRASASTEEPRPTP